MGWAVLVILGFLAAVLLLRQPFTEWRRRRKQRAQERKREWRRQRDAQKARRSIERAMNPAKAAARKGEPKWQQVAERQGNKCWLCGTRVYSDDVRRVDVGEQRFGATYPCVDYVTPVEQGGTYEVDNLRIAHRQCQQRRIASGPGVKFGPPKRTYPAASGS